MLVCLDAYRIFVDQRAPLVATRLSELSDADDLHHFPAVEFATKFVPVTCVLLLDLAFIYSELCGTSLGAYVH